MDSKHDGLWQGGPWEHPSGETVRPPSIPEPTGQRRRPLLRVKRRRKIWPWFAGLVALVLVLCMAAMLGRHFSLHDLIPDSFYPFSGPEGSQQEEFSTEPPDIPKSPTGTGVTLPLQPAGGQPLTYTQIYEKNAPSIVSIESQSQTEYGTGTGVILTPDGYIVTNAHVVAGAEQVRVALSDNSVLEANLVGFDPEEDLAVLKVEANGLTPAEFGDSSELRIGDPVAAIGDPLGYRSTITDGIVSSLDREVNVEGTTMVLIQTSAAINFGNSGGALINQYGQVVGITTIKIITTDGSAEALGFAIPTTRVKYVVDRLIDGQVIRSGVFGFTVYKFPADGGGLEILDVHPASDAYAQGLRAGDILQSVNGQTITGTQDLTRIKQSMGEGDVVSITYLRDGECYTVDVALVNPDTVDG